MKAFAAAALVALAVPAAWAQSAPAADVPAAKCEPKPVVPGRAMMQDKMVRRNFESDLKNYKDCMNAYLDTRKAAIKANEDAANAAIAEYNGVMKALNEQANPPKDEKK